MTGRLDPSTPVPTAGPAPVGRPTPLPASAPDPLEERLRTALAPGLQLVRAIGAGGMARVFLAREPALKRLVAVKVLAGDLVTSPEARARFEREAQAVASLSHPNIVAVHTVGELADGTPYFVMQYVDGRSMAARVEEEGPLPVAEARRVLSEVAAALAAAHRQGIIHRDVKPANILYEDATGRALVSDFGIAAIASQSGAPATEPRSLRLTSTGMLVGTPQYMSPEQLLGEPVGTATDVYSLGLLAHELLAGSGPFHGSTPNELIAAHLRDVPPRLVERRPDVDPELDALVARCLDKAAAKRPSADEVARRLSPGGVALLEWPPPGLETLRGALRPASVSYLLGDGLLLAALLPAVAAGQRLDGEGNAAIGFLLTLAALAGVVLLADGARRTLRLGRLATRAVRGGYAWMTVLETLADRAGDTGRLISGSREHAAMAPVRRGRLRLGRVVRELSLLAGGVATVPLLVAVFLAGSVGLAGPEAAWLAAAVPAAASGVALTLAAREWRALAALRARRWAPAEPDASRLAGPWYDSFEAVRAGQSLGRGGTAAAWAGRFGAAGVALLVAAAALLLLPLFLVAALGPAYWVSTTLQPSAARTKYAIASVTRPFEIAKDPGITPLDAGRALYALLATDHRALRGSAFPQQPLPLPMLPEPPWMSRMPAGLFPTARPKEMNGLPATLQIIAAAAHGLSPAEQAYLERIATAPHWRAMRTVAAAPRVDLAGARFVLPLTRSRAGWSDYPIPRFAPLKGLAYAGVARAAYHLSRGRRDSAEVALREVVSFGFAVADNGNTLIDELVGLVIVGIGREGLIQLYDAVGDPRGPRLKASLDSAVATADRLAENASLEGLPVRLDPATARDLTHRVADDPRELRGMRLESLAHLATTPCSNVRELVFGPAPDVGESFARARRNWARFPSDSSLLDLVAESPQRYAMSTPTERGQWMLEKAAALSGAVLRNDRLAGCTALLLSSGQ